MAVEDRLLERLIAPGALGFPARRPRVVLGVLFVAFFLVAFFLVAFFGAVCLAGARLVAFPAFLVLLTFTALFFLARAGFALDFEAFGFFALDTGFFAFFTLAARICCLARGDRYAIENFAWLSMA